MQINADRLLASLAEFARIGATPGGGVSRLALSDEDRAARDLLRLRMDEAGMTVRVDDFGTMSGRRPGIGGRSGRARSVPTSTLCFAEENTMAAYGVIAALEVVRTLNDAGIDHPPSNRRGQLD